jgi:hypothetical protein
VSACLGHLFSTVGHVFWTVKFSRRRLVRSRSRLFERRAQAIVYNRRHKDAELFRGDGPTDICARDREPKDLSSTQSCVQGHFKMNEVYVLLF